VTSLLDLLAGSPPLLAGTVFLLGLLVGSFLNVVIHRVPIMLDREWRAQCAELAGEPPAPAARFDLVRPRSACPACKAPITALQNVPVVSWLVLRGRCASCGSAISARYPIVELLTGLLSAAVAWQYGFGWPMACALVVTWCLVALTFIDVDTQLLPDSLTLPLLWGGLAASLWHAAWLGGVPPAGAAAALPVDTRSAVVGAIVGYLSLWSVYHLFRLVTGKEGMGYGDFKLLGALGAWLGWKMILPIVLVSALVGAIVGIALILRYGRDRNLPLAFGPYLAAAGWIMLMFGPQIVDRYLGLFRAAP
jgi:leader peptidase (prepilin peptidase)/N-methyltransferase